MRFLIYMINIRLGGMKTILQINSSLFNGSGQSSRLAGELVANLRKQHPHAEVIVRDLVKDPVPHLDAERFKALAGKELIDELQRADILVLGLPMYNFGVPSQLKAWFDHIARAGITFKYTDKGAVGLLTGKKAYVLATRGGLYAGTSADTQTEYVRQFLAFLGIENVEFIYAEGLAISAENKEASIRLAQQSIERIAA
jgi:FMN-dependent NADH-azoreductase